MEVNTEHKAARGQRENQLLHRGDVFEYQAPGSYLADYLVIQAEWREARYANCAIYYVVEAIELPVLEQLGEVPYLRFYQAGVLRPKDLIIKKKGRLEFNEQSFDL